MSKKPLIDPVKMADSVIIQRTYGIKDLERYLEKINKNIRVFQEAIGKERKEMSRVRGMIKVLQNDIRQAKKLKLLKKK